MLRTHFMKQRSTLSDLTMEEAFFDTRLLRDLAKLNPFGRMPDNSTILRFRHRLDKHKLAEPIPGTECNSLLHGEEVDAFGDAG